MRITCTFIAMALALLATACGNAKQDPERQYDEDIAGNEARLREVTVENLCGRWLEPIPGQEPAMMGFELNPDGKANTINIHTLVFERWELKGDTLLVWNHTAGVKNESSYVDTSIIKALTDSTLEVLPVNGVWTTYMRAR